MFASVGYTGQNYEFSSAYQNLLDNQIVKVGVKIPILELGKTSWQGEVAKSNREVVLSKIRQEQMDFNQDIFLLVANFNNQAQQLEIAEEADLIAEKRYKTSVETFMIGKISTSTSTMRRTPKTKPGRNTSPNFITIGIISINSAA